MRRILYFLHAIGMLFLISSCIKEDMEECPVYTVKVYVKDKNYSNIEEIPRLVKKMKVYLIVNLWVRYITNFVI